MNFNAKSRRNAFRAVALAALLAGACSPAFSQDAFPAKPLHLMVPYGAGGPTDVAARLLAEGMGQNLAQTIVVENRTGAFGQIAIDAVRQAGADGYTLMYASVPQAVVFPAILEGDSRGTSLKTFRGDFRIVGLSNSYDNLVLTGASSGVKNVKELVERIRSAGAPVPFAAFGAGAMPDLALGHLIDLAGGKAEPILYKSGPQAQVDIIADRVLLGIDSVGTTMGALKEGKIVALATLGARRARQLPDVPTMAEAGLPQMMQIDWRVWNAFFVPAATPAPRIERLNAALVKAGGDPRIQSRFSDLNLDLLATASLRESETFWSTQYSTWQPLIKKMGVKMPD